MKIPITHAYYPYLFPTTPEIDLSFLFGCSYMISLCTFVPIYLFHVCGTFNYKSRVFLNNVLPDSSKL